MSKNAYRITPADNVKPFTSRLFRHQGKAGLRYFLCPVIHGDVSQASHQNATRNGTGQTDADCLLFYHKGRVCADWNSDHNLNPQIIHKNHEVIHTLSFSPPVHFIIRYLLRIIYASCLNCLLGNKKTAPPWITPQQGGITKPSIFILRWASFILFQEWQPPHFIRISLIIANQEYIFLFLIKIAQTAAAASMTTAQSTG